MIDYIKGRTCSIIRAPDGRGSEQFFRHHPMPGTASLQRNCMGGITQKCRPFGKMPIGIHDAADFGRNATDEDGYRGLNMPGISLKGDPTTVHFKPHFYLPAIGREHHGLELGSNTI